MATEPIDPEVRSGISQNMGDKTIDPTHNVIALVEANAKSFSQLREADVKFNDAQHYHLKEIGQLRAEHASTLRTSDLDRQEKTRQVDVMAAAASAAQLATAVSTLATTADRNAETLRNQLNSDRAALAKLVADTAQALSTQNDSLMKDVNNRIAELQKSSYQGVGKSMVTDPMMAEFIQEMKAMASGALERRGRDTATDPAIIAMSAEVKALTLALANSGGKQQGATDSRQLLTWLLGVALALISLYTFTQRPSASSTPAPPQVIVVPAGATVPGSVQTGPATPR